MEIATIPVGQVDEFYFYMHLPIKAWLFEKIIFELVYLFMVSYLYSFNPFISINEIAKYFSHSIV